MNNMTTQRKIIAEITDADFNPAFVQQTSIDDYMLRKAARGILVKDNEMALMHVTTQFYHGLPGGGIEIGESIEEGFKREMLEETGCTCEIIDIDDAFPVTIEYRDASKIFQISYILCARAVGNPIEIAHTEEEKAEGLVLKWVPLKEVRNIMSKDYTQDHIGKFIQKRDRAIVDYYIDRLVV